MPDSLGFLRVARSSWSCGAFCFMRDDGISSAIAVREWAKRASSTLHKSWNEFRSSGCTFAATSAISVASNSMAKFSFSHFRSVAWSCTIRAMRCLYFGGFLPGIARSIASM